MTFAPITADDLAPSLLAADHLGDDATLLRDCEDFARWCDERRDAWADDLDAATEAL